MCFDGADAKGLLARWIAHFLFSCTATFLTFSLGMIRADKNRAPAVVTRLLEYSPQGKHTSPHRESPDTVASHT